MTRILLLAIAAGAGAAVAGAATPLLADLESTQRHAEEVAGTVARAALAGDRRALERGVRRITALDAKRNRADLPATGLADQARLLAAALAPSSAARRTALRRVLADADGELSRLVEGLRAQDDAERAARLLADDRHDRRAALLNDAVRPFGVGTNLLAIVNPVLLAGSALDTIIATTRNVLRWDRLTTREREALARYRAAVARNAAAERSPELARATQRLSAKRRRALCETVLEQAEAALEAGALARATARLREVETLDDCAERAAAARERLADAERDAAAALDAAIWPAIEPTLPRTHAEERAWRSLALAVVTADAGAIGPAADRLLAIDDDGPFVPGVTLAQALGFRLRGRHAQAEGLLEELRREDGPVGEYAAGVLAGPGFGDAGALAAAERRHRAAVARFVALGGVSGTSTLKSAAHVAAYGAAGAQSLGIGNAIGVLARAYRAWRHDPAPNDAIITRGEEYLVRHPFAADRDDVRRRLARAYERAERYDRALLHLKATREPDAGDLARLEQKLGKQMLERAGREDADPALLAAIVAHLPGTDAADTARDALEARADAAGMAVTRAQLVRHPDLLGPDGLDLAPGLLDGDGGNGEIADGGITLRAAGMELRLESDGDAPRLDHRALDAESAPRVYAAVETILYREALAGREDGAERGRFEDYVPFFVTGTVGDSGVNMYPGVKLRPYDAAHPERYR